MALKDYIAIHTIHVTKTPGKAANKATGASAVAPEVTAVSPNAPFRMDEDEGDALVAAGAARVAPSKGADEGDRTDAEKAAAAKEAAAKAPAKKAAAKAPAKKAPAKKPEAKTTEKKSDEDLL